MSSLEVGRLKIILSTSGTLFLTLSFSFSAFAQWIQTNGIKNLTVTSLAVQGGYLFAGTSWWGVYWSTDGGMNWLPRRSGLTDTLVRALASDGTILFAGTDGSGVFRSTDNGATWTSASVGIGSQRILSLAADRQTVFAGTYSNGVYRSTDQARTWLPMNNGISSGFARALSISDSGVFLGTDYGGVFRSTNLGANWQAFPVPNTNGWIASIFVIGSTILASADLYPNVFRSTNLGVQWQNSDSGMTAPAVYSFAYARNTIFAATYWGFFYSTDGGISWTDAYEGMYDVTHGLLDLTLYALAVDSNFIYAGGFEKGVWKRPFSEFVTGLEERTNESVSNFRLFQNYPNPFNPSTMIRYGLPHKSAVQLTVYNALGQQVATLVQAEQEAGYYELKFGATELSSGVYFYRMQAGGYVATKKLLLIR